MRYARAPCLYGVLALGVAAFLDCLPCVHAVQVNYCTAVHRPRWQASPPRRTDVQRQVVWNTSDVAGHVEVSELRYTNTLMLPALCPLAITRACPRTHCTSAVKVFICGTYGSDWECLGVYQDRHSSSSLRSTLATYGAADIAQADVPRLTAASLILICCTTHLLAPVAFTH